MSSRAGNYSRLACEFYFVRSMGYYLIHIYIPSCLIVVLSWVSFWLHRDASPARVGLGITTVLTMVTILSSSNASLPKISYLKSIDFYLVTCFFMVFASLLEFACVSYINNLGRSVSASAGAATAPTGTGRPTSNFSKPLVLPAEVHVEAGQSRTCARHDGGNGKKANKLATEMVVTVSIANTVFVELSSCNVTLSMTVILRIMSDYLHPSLMSFFRSCFHINTPQISVKFVSEYSESGFGTLS